ncbi:MAG TPA: response regulator [Chthoniobacterales bacterium]|nr:response regulator [Chthoniobacterales bacterium]
MTLIQFNPDWQAQIAPENANAVRVAAVVASDIPVLIAEDDAVSRKLATVVTELAGFRTIVTSDGIAAMSAVRAQSGPCVAVLDWMMPGMDGAEICRRIRESAKPIYIILLTARGTKEDIVEGLECGADDYLSKPFDRNELLARIRAGVRILEVQAALAERVRELEESVLELRPVRFQMPL